MPGQKSSLPIIIVMVVSGLCGLLPAWPGMAQAEQAEAAPPAVLPDLAPIMQRVAEIRGLPFTKDVPAEEQSMDDFKKMMLEEIEKEYGDGEEFSEIVDGLMRLGLLKERIELDEAFVSAFASQAAAYYDPESGKFFYLYTDVPADQLEGFAAHELVHALQDQHFDLGGIVEEELMAASNDDEGPRNDDYILAVRCLIEGEATYVMNLFSMGDEAGNMMTDMMARIPMDQMIEMSQMAVEQGALEGDLAEAMEAMDELPNYILAPLFAAYMSGAAFAKHLHGEGGWEGLAGAWANRPPTTEMCLHPEKYTGEAVDLPTTITLPEFPSLKDAGWRLIDTAIHGEFYLDMLLREHGVSDGDARRASYGWDGDVYQAWKNEAGEVAIILATTWDRERDALQFYEAYQEVVNAKYPERTYDESRPYVAFDCGGDLGHAAVRASGQEVFIIEGFSEEIARDLVEELAALEVEHVDSVPRAEAFANAAIVQVDRGDDNIALDGFSFIPDANWQKVEPASPMRAAQYNLPAVDGDNEDAEFVIFYFGDGHGGSYEANLERWKSQFAEAIEPVIGSKDSGDISIRTFDIAGRYVAETAPGSGERVEKPNFRMMTAVIESSPGPYYLKVVGPRATMDHWEASIRAMIQSIRPRDDS